MLLVDLNYNFEFDWFVELSDNKLSDSKLSDNNLASELVANRSCLITSEEIVIFMINNVMRRTSKFNCSCYLCDSTSHEVMSDYKIGQ